MNLVFYLAGAGLLCLVGGFHFIVERRYGYGDDFAGPAFVGVGIALLIGAALAWVIA